MKKIILLLILSLSGTMLAAAPRPKDTPPPPPPRDHRGPGPAWDSKHQRVFWRAFSELSDAERKEMMTLQRNDPDKFREVMKGKVEKILKGEQADREKLAEFTKLYQAAKSDAEKAAIKKQAEKILKKRFEQRLASNRKQLEAMKRRAQQLEKELDKREASKDKIVELHAEAILSGKMFFRHPGERRGPGGRKPFPPRGKRPGENRPEQQK